MGRRKLTYGQDPNLPLLCAICGDKARGNNFSVLSCVSCKSFFRRHGTLSVENLQCRYEGNCVFQKETRSDCLPCRLRKCMESGMDPLKIRRPVETQRNSNRNRPPVSTDERVLQLPMPKPLSLLQNDRSTLTSDQWSLLSNIISSFDEQNFNKGVNCLLAEKSALPVKLRLKNADTIHFLSRTYKTVLPLMEHSPHVHCLSRHARQALLSNNVVYTASLSGYFIGYETDSFNHPTYMSACSALFGGEFMMKYARDNSRLLANGNIYKLMLFVLIFSSNCSIVMFNDDSRLETTFSEMELFHVQNIYVTMLWKYLVYIYGYDGAAIQYSRMIKNLLDMFARTEELLGNLTYKLLIDEIAAQTQRSLTLND